MIEKNYARKEDYLYGNGVKDKVITTNNLYSVNTEVEHDVFTTKHLSLNCYASDKLLAEKKLLIFF